MRFLANMGVSSHTVEWLRQRGHDAVHLREGAIISVGDDSIRVRRLPIE